MTTIVPNPQTKKWSQLNKGDLLSELYSSRSIDLSTPGILKLAQRTSYVGQKTSGDLLDVQAIVYGNFQSSATTFQYWIVSNGGVLTLEAGLTGLTEDALSNTPTPGSGGDGCQWNGNLIVSKTSRISRLVAGTWTASWSSADFTNTGSGFPHPVEPNVTNANVLAGDGNVLKKVAADGTITTALTLPTQYTILWIKRGAKVNFIGLDGGAGGLGAIAVWDGLDTTLEANQLIELDARTPVSGVKDDNGDFYIIQSDARMMRYNGSGFDYEAELPPYREYLARFDWGGNLSTYGRVMPRGMTMVRGKIHVVVSGALNSSTLPYIPSFPSGVWVYDKDNSAFYHHYLPSNSNTATDFGQWAGTTMIGAIFPVVQGRNTDPTATVGSLFITGGRYFGATQAATVLRTIVSVVTGENRGTFVTRRIETASITANEMAIWCKYQGLTTATDKIIFKYRTAYRDPIVLDNSVPLWSSTTVFTTTDTGMAGASVGDEITVLHGNGSGCTAHISSISLVTGTYTVTLDEAITGVSNTDNAIIIVENWTKLTPTIIYTDTEGQKRINLPIANKVWFQIKAELRGEGGVVGIQELQMPDKKQLPAT